jgi:hypothetical protein
VRTARPYKDLPSSEGGTGRQGDLPADCRLHAGRDWGDQTATSSFGHFCAEVPKSLRIGAYPRISLIDASCGTYYETPASCDIRGGRLSEIGVIAMQKVEGSSPFSRFASNPLQTGHSPLAREIETTLFHRHHFGHQFPKWRRCAAFGGDYGRFRLPERFRAGWIDNLRTGGLRCPDQEEGRDARQHDDQRRAARRALPARPRPPERPRRRLDRDGAEQGLRHRRAARPGSRGRAFRLAAGTPLEGRRREDRPPRSSLPRLREPSRSAGAPAGA